MEEDDIKKYKWVVTKPFEEKDELDDVAGWFKETGIDYRYRQVEYMRYKKKLVGYVIARYGHIPKGERGYRKKVVFV
jgi:hypothetical protein